MNCKNCKRSITRIDKCMKPFINNLNQLLDPDWKVIACCCGHKRYPMTIVCRYKNLVPDTWEIVSNTKLNHINKFYKKDSDGFYYIPEVVGK